MGKKKGNKDEANGDVEEVVEENAASVAKDAGKKAKKGRKKKDEDWEDDVAKELENMTLEETGDKEPEPERESVPEKKEKKKEKKSKKSKTEDSDSEEEIQGNSKRGRGFAALMDAGSDDDDDDDSDEPVIEEKKEKKKNKKPEKPVKKSTGFAALMDEDSDDVNDEDMDEADTEEKKDKKKNKKQEKPVKKGAGFAALMDEGGDDLNDDDDMDEPVIEEKKDKDKNKKQEKPATPAGNKNDKKKGKKGKKQKNDEEDLDQILAELEMEYKGEKPKEEPKKEEPKVIEEASQTAEESGKKKKKQKKKEASVEPEKEDTPTEVAEKESVEEPIKVTEAEEAKEKKEDEGTQEDASKAKKKKKKKAKDAKEDAAAQPDASVEETPASEEQSEKVAEADEDGKKKKKKGKDAEDDKKKKGKDAEEDKARKGKPSKKALAAMKEILAKQKEEEERLRKEEEERLRKEEEELRRIEEEKRIEQEKRERRKQKEKERKERLKAEGKLLTPKQKAEQKRAQEMLEHLKAQGALIPEVGERRPRPGTRIKPKKPKKDEKAEDQAQEESAKVDEVQKTDMKIEETPMDVDAPAVGEVKEEEEEEEVKDAWDESSDDDEEEEDDTSEATKTSQETEVKKTNDKKGDEEDDAEEESEDDEDEEEEESEVEEMSEEHMKEAEKRKQRAIDRIAKRKEENLKKLDPDILRAPVVCVLGHVDHGKTKILDKLRRTNVQEGEVGGITQQIGATNVPADAVKRQTHMVKDFDMGSLKFPGLLIIDTPGHESFRNLRSRGSSLCDIAILVVDITQGLEPQTRESISLLRQRGTPFVVALNKVDRIYEWDSHPSKDIREIINLQSEPSKNDFERRTSQIIQGLREEKLNSALFWENPNPKEYISLVPTSAISGDGMGNLISLICTLCQQRLKKTLMFAEELQCTVLEVKTIQGHGTTIDVILVNGRLREGDTILVAGTEGPIVTQIRSLLLPKPLKEIRVKGQYDEFKEVAAAQGVKIAARDLEKAIAGLSLKVAYHEDEIDIIRELVDREFKSAMRSIKVKDRGVYVQASTLGALEALLEFFKTNDVPYSGIRVGPVVKRDVMRAAAMLEHDPMYAVILAFDVKVEKDAQELADKEGVKIFSEETIYHLGDRYVDYLKDYKKKKQDEFRSIAVFPSRLKIIPTAIFNKRDPIVLGVTVDAGVLRTGTPLCVPSKEFVEIGVVTSMEFDHKSVDIAKKGVDVCIKIEPVPGHTPKLFGRHFEAEDLLVSKISRESINACKDHFRDDLSKTDWKLMAELKKQFQIL